MTPGSEDVIAAMALAKEHPILKDDPITKRAFEEGVDASGNPVNWPKFVQGRGAFLEMESARNRLKRMIDEDPELANSIVVNSVRPDLEKFIN